MITVDEINQASERARKYRLAHILEMIDLVMAVKLKS